MDAERLRDLLRRWVESADAGELDGVDLGLLAESEDAIGEEDNSPNGRDPSIPF